MWEQVYGHEQNKQLLRHLLTLDKRTPSLLFYGPAGVGKKLLARAFAKSFLCLAEGEEACQCPSCRAFAAHAHADFICVEQLEEGKEIVLEQIKTLATQATYAPTLSQHKVCLIDTADLMNATAANSLLKLLEEPPAYWLFILVATTTDKLLPTILSRVMQVRFGALPEHQVEAALLAAGVAPVSAPTLARLADGSLGEAMRLQTVNALECRDEVLNLLEQLPTGRVLELFAQQPWPDKITGQQGLLYTEMLLFLLRDGLLCQEALAAELYNIDASERIKSCFQSWSTGQIMKIIPIVQDSYQALVAKAGSKIVLEALVIKMNKICKGELICQQ
ncbi:MAG: AAA family ATPase [Acidaminococcaceae bacterium]